MNDGYVGALIGHTIRSRRDLEWAINHDAEFCEAVERLRGFIGLALSCKPSNVKTDLPVYDAQQWVDMMVLRMFYETQSNRIRRTFAQTEEER